MNWISNRNRPTVKKVNIVKDIPDNYWDKCAGCGNMLYHFEIQKKPFCLPHLSISLSPPPNGTLGYVV